MEYQHSRWDSYHASLVVQKSSIHLFQRPLLKFPALDTKVLKKFRTKSRIFVYVNCSLLVVHAVSVDAHRDESHLLVLSLQRKH